MAVRTRGCKRPGSESGWRNDGPAEGVTRRRVANGGLCFGNLPCRLSARLVKAALGHDLRLPLILFLGEAFHVLEQHLGIGGQDRRSEEHTSELQSLRHL